MSDLNGTYTLDPTHSTVGFVVRHAMISKVRGYFRSFDATLTVDAEDQARSSASATIQIDSIDTGNADRIPTQAGPIPCSTRLRTTSRT